jgi:hypothetical protein
LVAAPASYQLADYAGELREAAPRADGFRHFDTPGMIAKLKEMHVNTYYYLIYHSPATDWDDLRNEFAPAAQAAGIQIVVYLVPPTETGSTQYSGPYKTDYVAWAQAIATLSAQYTNITNWAIDDFSLNLNKFTPSYLAQMQQAARSINPNLKFTPQMYTTGLTSAFLQSSSSFIDGVIIAFRDDPHRNTQVLTSEQSQIDSIYNLLHPYNLPLYWMVYASRLSSTPTSPTADYIDRVTQTALDNIHSGELAGIITYVLYKDTAPGQESSENKAVSGLGYLNLFVPGGNPTAAGHYSAASQTITPDGTGSYSLAFQSMEEGPNVAGYHFKQLLVDGTVAWEQDTSSTDSDLKWQTVNVDLSAYLKDKSSATLTFRLFEKKGVTNFNQNASFDHLQPTGFSLTNGDFEDRSGWSLSSAAADMISDIIVYDPDRRAHAFDAVKENYTIFSDTTPPVTTAVSDPAQPDGKNGWYVHPVTLTLQSQDDSSGVAGTEYSLDGGVAWQPYTGAMALAQDGNYSLSYRSKDQAGNVEQAHSLIVQIDQTAPTVTYSVYSGTVYTVDQTVNIACQAADVLSGVASTTCQNITGPAYSFGLGTHSYSSEAVDQAGNAGTGSTSFNVNVTWESFIQLLKQLFAQYSTDHNGIEKSLEAKLLAAMASDKSGEADVRNHILDAFQNELSAQSGKILSVPQAESLKGLARALMK